MGFRVKLRKTFSSSANKKASTSSQLGPDGETLYMHRTDIEYYKPHEIPKSKYRGKVDPEHAASLQAFSMFDAFSTSRKRSSVALSGTYSPGGTNNRSAAQSRVQSRAPSRVPSRRPSMEHSGLRQHTEPVDDEGSSSSSTSRSFAASTILDLGTASTSLSAPAEPIKLSQHDSGIDMAGLSKQVTAHDTPFTVEELERAMTKATLRHNNRFSGERRVGLAL